MEAGVAPGAGVVAVGGVEDAPLALRAGPGPGLGAGLVVAGLEDVAVLRVVLGVDVGLVPGAERLEPLDDRMVGVDDRRLELAGAVLLELGADQRDVLGRVQEAERGAVQRDEAAAARDVVEQRLLLVLADLRRVGVDEQRVVLAERLGVQVRHLLGVGHLDPASGQDRGDLRVAIGGAVMPLVAEEEDRERPRDGRIGRVGGSGEARGRAQTARRARSSCADSSRCGRSRSRQCSVEPNRLAYVEHARIGDHRT